MFDDVCLLFTPVALATTNQQSNSSDWITPSCVGVGILLILGLVAVFFFCAGPCSLRKKVSCRRRSRLEEQVHEEECESGRKGSFMIISVTCISSPSTLGL